MTENFKKLIGIINKTKKTPTIVNKDSKFVVVTYYWGKNNFNSNTARPCISYFEEIVNNIKAIAIGQINLGKKPVDKTRIANNIENEIENNPKFIQLLEKFANVYLDGLKENLNISSNKITSQKIIFEMGVRKNALLTSKNYKYMELDEVKEKLKQIIKIILVVCKDEIKKLFLLKVDIAIKEKHFIDNKGNLSENDKNELIQQIQNIKNNKNDINNTIKKKLNTNIKEYGINNIEGQSNMSIYQILHNVFRFTEPVKFGEMISKWEDECRDNKCNFLAVEYPEFAEKGGYQLAINAKPLFIKKALELCNGRSVLYIDGDMYIRKYPHIFDIEDVDFMARGWWIDPRSSYKMNESITIDPYLFETSGGTMFFSNSQESHFLIDKWIENTAKEYQMGKADDRILSLVFNSYRLLLTLKIIQLPIEYLWLTLDYDERLLELEYDYDKNEMKKTIFIEHPECLTSEDTASGQGASSDRTPKFYEFLNDVYPISEEIHEKLFFKNKEMALAFKDYFNYLKKTTYINDGNENLIEQNFINENDDSNNEAPFYIIPYEKEFGNKTKTVNENIILSKEIEIDYFNTQINNNIIFITKNYSQERELIPFILKHLLENRDVLYNPINSNGYNSLYFKNFNENKKIYGNYDFVYVPLKHIPIRGTNGVAHFNEFFKQGVDINQPIFFSPNEILIKFLSMFEYLSDLSDKLNYGSYEFISRVRVCYLPKFDLKKETKKKFINILTELKKTTKLIGGSKLLNTNLYYEGIVLLYGLKNTQSTLKNTQSTLKNSTLKNSTLKNSTLKKRKRKTPSLRLSKIKLATLKSKNDTI